MKFINLTMVAAMTAATLATAGAANARDQIQMVGSSTVFPFSTAVAEKFGSSSKFPTPVVESTGTGGGFKLFCAGVGEDTPDIQDASRAVKSSEFETCASNGITMTEIKIGFDGIVMVNAKAGPAFSLRAKEIYLALAAQVPNGNGGFMANPNKKWSDIDPSLPDVAISVYGPPPTSGTRDAFVELAMEEGAKAIDQLADLKKDDKKKFAAIAGGIREDGVYIEAGENDNLIVQKLEASPDSVGIFGYSYLEQNGDKIKGAAVDGHKPTFETIADGSYELSRPLFIYVKREHVGVIPGIKEYLAEYTSDKAWGPEGYLSEKGLIPLPDDMRAEMAKTAADLPELKM